ncbi:hypothetical protein CfE428DRAFT_3448 [Chthoniobacter flavus Ellin428]|uniref:Lipoprotein n=1 Tax=Chthoniobacter flavus Ellin428 TaxID=497964 RepID=B4D3G0_9BACT|nr:hypothetical protein [Chthoniobacter flavus]EDY19271.1 hypothetical protein CfE428DRAFT_3448 [Chthoniobacter flavus Ellin428]TCO88113.1 hypothetical protein EV701_119157 [Chthoniobacter flavus]
MKQFCPLALAILFAGCAITPQDREASHQRQLEKEARANFIALKSQEHPGQAVVLHDEAAATTAATAPRPRASLQPTSHFVPTTYVPPAPAHRASRQDDTVYYWQVQATHRRTTPRQQAAEARYARELAKRPEDLTPEERTWADEHY